MKLWISLQLLPATVDNYEKFNNRIVISITEQYNLNFKSGIISNIDTILNSVKMKATLKDCTQ